MPHFRRPPSLWQKRPHRLTELADRVRAVEADPACPFARAGLSHEIRDLQGQEERRLTAQDREANRREWRHRKEMLEHDAYAKGFEDGRQDALGRAYTYSIDATRDAHTAFYTVRERLDAACVRLNDSELSEIADQLGAAAARVAQTANVHFQTATELVTERKPRHSFAPRPEQSDQDVPAAPAAE